ncbi:DUF1080 domain-containing protein [Streptomyces sp. NBC_00250]|uniref:hypothetical protein n=1 Tax=Streptomyces sp. NBC_00250 TaxID=2903641 RepID=UPI002E291268|nr:hypothetical protein [Streptomyces sp. NBC_00250]
MAFQPCLQLRGLRDGHQLKSLVLLHRTGPPLSSSAVVVLGRSSLPEAVRSARDQDIDIGRAPPSPPRAGSFDDAAALARVPALVRHGATYHLRIVHRGNRIEVFLDGDRIIDLTDTAATYGAGHVGLNVFGGRAGYQDTYAKEL